MASAHLRRQRHHAASPKPMPQRPTPPTSLRSSLWQSILITTVLFIGVGLVLYPAVGAYLSSHSFDDQVASYDSSVAGLDKATRKRMLAQARAYNARLNGSAGSAVRDPFAQGDEATSAAPSDYDDVLNVDGNGLMGTLTIPSIDMDLPIHHGTSDDVLDTGAGHIPQTSLPVGGKGTHAVLTGHTGIPNKTLFTNLIHMKRGDVFIINVLGERHAYKVDRIKVVEPQDVSQIQMEPGKEYVTLLTCTPYGVNSHRLLVRGVPTALPADSDSLRHPMPWMLLLAAVVMFILASGTFMVLGLQRICRGVRWALLVAILLLAWLIAGLIMRAGVVPFFDVGYSWFDSHILPLFGLA